MRTHGRYAAVLGACLLTLCGRAAAEDAPRVVAHAALGGRQLTVTADELKLEIALIRRGGDGKAAALTAASLDSVIEAVWQRKLLAAEATRRHLDVERSVTTMLARSSEVVLADVQASRTAAAVDTSREAVQQYYERNGERFRSVARRKVRHIVVPSEADARAARAEIAGGASFEAVARAKNVDGTAVRGGDLGWIEQGAMVKAFDQAVFSLDRGTISAPVQTSMGWHLAIVDDVDPGTLLPLALVRDRVVETMRQEAVAALTRKLFDEAKPSIDRAALDEVLR